jgi:hypothetical protein
MLSLLVSFDVCVDLGGGGVVIYLLASFFWLLASSF